jgi:serine protease Do
MVRFRYIEFAVIMVLVAALGGGAGAVMSGYVNPHVVTAQPAQLPAAVIPASRSPFIAAVARVRPAVVNISTVQTVQNPFGDQPFFNQFPGMPSGPMQQKAIGSGVIVSPAGYILTNAHVVNGAQQLMVTLLDGRTFKGTVVGSDSATDVAVVKVPATNLPTAPLGNSEDLQPGDWAIAIGNPYGLNFTVTAGVISAMGRTLPNGPEETFIQTDAPINPGNSGGPLVDTQGQVIGINSAKFEGAQGIGFSIPIDTARGIMSQLIATGHIVRPYVGVYLESLTPELATRLHLPAGTKGAVITRVMPNSPAAAAGLVQGDVIIKAADQPTPDAGTLVTLIHQQKVGEKVTLVVLHQGQSKSITVTLGQAPANPQQ